MSLDRYLSIDPGRVKWGIAIVDAAGACHFREVAAASAAPERVLELCARIEPAAVLVGDRTSSALAVDRLGRLVCPILRVPEHGTTLAARDLYWRDRPPRGWRRWAPRGLLHPPEPIDGYAAEAIALRYLEAQRAG